MFRGHVVGHTYSWRRRTARSAADRGLLRGGGVSGVAEERDDLLRKPVEAFELAVERAHPTIHCESAFDEARQALAMGPTARLIDEKRPDDAIRETIARDIEAAYTVEAASGPIRLPGTIFLVSARRPA